MSAKTTPFPTVAKLATECGATWPSFQAAVDATGKAEALLLQALKD